MFSSKYLLSSSKSPEIILKGLQAEQPSAISSFGYDYSIIGSNQFHAREFAVSEHSDSVPAFKYAFPWVFYESVSPVLNCQKRHRSVLFHNIEKRNGRRREVIVLFSGVCERAFFLRDIIEYVRQHSSKAKTD